MTDDVNPIKTYSALYAYVVKLAARAISRKWPYLFAAPLAMLVYELAVPIVVKLFGGLTGGGFAAGLGLSIVRALGISLVLFSGRAIIEQQNLTADDFGRGLLAFFGDVITVFFSLWIASYLLGSISPLLAVALYLATIVLPVPETVALSKATGYGIFGAAWRFMQRDWAPWLVGHVAVLAILAVYVLAGFALKSVPLGFLPAPLWRPAMLVLSALPNVFLLVAFVYRGILYLTLDELSPWRRREKFGGAPSLR